MVANVLGIDDSHNCQDCTILCGIFNCLVESPRRICSTSLSPERLNDAQGWKMYLEDSFLAVRSLPHIRPTHMLKKFEYLQSPPLAEEFCCS